MVPLGLCLLATAYAQPDVLAMVQGAAVARTVATGGVRFSRTDPSQNSNAEALKHLNMAIPSFPEGFEQVLEQVGPFAIQSNTVGFRLPDKSRPASDASPWGQDQMKGFSFRGINTKEGFHTGSFVTGGVSDGQAHALYGAGYTARENQPAKKMIGAAQVHPGLINLVNAVTNMDGGMDYSKVRADVKTGHIDTYTSNGHITPEQKEQTGTAAPAWPAETGWPTELQRPAAAPAAVATAAKPAALAAAAAAVHQAKAAPQVQQPQAPRMQAPQVPPQVLAGQLQWAAAQAVQESKRRAEEEANRRKASEEQKWLEAAAAAAKKAEEAKRQAEEAKAIEAWLQKQAATRHALQHPVSPPVPSKALDDWMKRAGEDWLRRNAAQQKAIEDWMRKTGRRAEPKDDAQKLGQFLQELGKAAEHVQREQLARAHPMQMQKNPVMMHNDQGSHHVANVLQQMRMAAQAAMTSPGSRLPNLLQTGAAVLEDDVDVQKDIANVSAGEADAAQVHLHATQNANMEMQKMAMAKERLQKAVQAVQKSKRRISALDKENVTAMVQRAKANAKRMEMTNKAVSYRLKQAERESLKGKHLKFDKKTYMQRVKNGNFSTYGLWTTYNTKQHFGEKTWDILSNHIFGLDKLMKHLFNATDSERKAQGYLKLEKKYNAMGAAAQEEKLELEVKIEEANAEMAAAKAALQEAAQAKAVQLAMKRTARKQMAKEHAAHASSRAALLKAQREARKQEAEESEEKVEAEAATGKVAEATLEEEHPAAQSNTAVVSSADEPAPAAAEVAASDDVTAAAIAEGKDAAEQEVQAIIDEAKDAEAKDATAAGEASSDSEPSPEMKELDAEMEALEAEEKLMEMQQAEN